MLDSDFIKRTCRSYLSGSRVTIKGLAGRLSVSSMTLYRVNRGFYADGHSYRMRKPSHNRRIDYRDFPTVRAACQQIRAR